MTIKAFSALGSAGLGGMVGHGAAVTREMKKGSSKKQATSAVRKATEKRLSKKKKKTATKSQKRKQLESSRGQNAIARLAGTGIGLL